MYNKHPNFYVVAIECVETDIVVLIFSYIFIVYVESSATLQPSKLYFLI